MLKLKDIKKVYVMGKKNDKDRQVVNALNGVNLEFRENEFVSILGQSGCGKTTLLNIIGGLDKYTSGDLIINGISTKAYKDKDWDTYRNHRVGFIFQSYNLIPHLNVLQNVELALTLSGVSKKERTQRAIDALKQVGLEDKLKSKPNQLSGGQMQRVSIARALVNDPEIILADEPTGALDSNTSLQIMELLKKISSNKLIIMVTHNPELAEIYSSRIVSLKDGCVIDDTMPYSSREEKSKSKKSKTNTSKESVVNDTTTQNVVDKEEFKTEKVKNKKKKMSFFTALSLSFKNLITKKARTLLVSIAGSIGIIGIALILAVSSGFKGYIDNVQKDTLSNYPLTIQSSTLNYTTLLTSLMGGGTQKDKDHELDKIYADTSITDMMKDIISDFKTNDLGKFYTHLKENEDEIKPYVNDIQYGYNISIDVFNEKNYKISTTSSALYDIVLSFCVVYLQDLTLNVDNQNGEKGFTVRVDENKMYIFKINNEATNDSIQAGIAILSQYLGADSEIISKFKTGQEIALSEDLIADLIMTSFENIPLDKFENYDLQAVNPMMNNIELIKSQYDIVAKSTEYENKDVLTNLKDNQAVLVLDQNNELDDYILYALGFVTHEELVNDIRKTMDGNNSEIGINYLDVLTTYNDFNVLVDTDYYLDLENNNKYVNINTPKQINQYNANIDSLVANSSNSIEIVAVLRAKDSNGCLNTGINYNSKYLDKLISYYNSSVAVTGIKDGTPISFDENSAKLSPLSLDKPSSISFYFNSFADKDKVIEFIDDYNKNCQEGETISYNDLTGMIMSSVTTIINAITYVLVAFVSISLIVSSIMIGIITYISVIERTKEIGVLRSIGASKKDVKRVFTAESLIVGFSAGALGIIVSLLLTIPINIVIKSFTGIANMAVLSPVPAIILIAISMTLTFIAGLLPANVASKKDPVIALRTE